jgi:hypothetical protein
MSNLLVLAAVIGSAHGACIDSEYTYNFPKETHYLKIQADPTVTLTVTQASKDGEDIGVTFTGSGRNDLVDRINIIDELEETGTMTISIAASDPDCTGVPNGNAEVLACGCDDADSCNDCAGVPNGNAEVLQCGCDDADSCIVEAGSSVVGSDVFTDVATSLQAAFLGPLAWLLSVSALCEVDGMTDVVQAEVALPWGYELHSIENDVHLYWFNPTYFGFAIAVEVPGKSQSNWVSADEEELLAQLKEWFGDVSLTFTQEDAAPGENGYVLTVFVNGLQSEEDAVVAQDQFVEAGSISLGNLGTCVVAADGDIGTLCAPGYVRMEDESCVLSDACVSESSCLSCTGYKNLGFPNGFYSIYLENAAKEWYWLEVYCHMTTIDTVGRPSVKDGTTMPDDVAYTFYYISDGVDSYSAYGDNDCTELGMKIWIPRTKDHWKRAYDYIYNEISTGSEEIRDILHPFAVVRPHKGCGTCTSHALNYDVIMTQPEVEGVRWQAWDGGRFWVRDTKMSEPNGDYNPMCWLGLNGLNFDSINFNDLYCDPTVPYGYPTGSQYLCSTNDVYSIDHPEYPQFSDPEVNAAYWDGWSGNPWREMYG